MDFISHYFEANFKLSLLCFLFAWTFCLCYLLRFLQLCGQIKKSLKSWNFNVHKVTLLQNTLTLQLMRYVVADVQLDTILKRCLCQHFDQSSLPTRVLIDNPIDTTLDTKPGRTVKKGLRNLLFWIINVGTSERKWKCQNKQYKSTRRGQKPYSWNSCANLFFAKKYLAIMEFFRSFPNNQKMCSFYNRQKNSPNLVDIVVIQWEKSDLKRW